MPQIKVPAALAGGSSSETVDVEGGTIREILDNHAATHGDQLRSSVIAEGELKEFINVFVDGEEVQSLDEPVDANALVRVIPAASGGAAAAAP